MAHDLGVKIRTWFESKQVGDTQEGGKVISNPDSNSPAPDQTRTYSKTETGESIDGNVITLADKGGAMGGIEPAANIVGPVTNGLKSINDYLNEFGDYNDNSPTNESITEADVDPREMIEYFRGSNFHHSELLAQV